MSHVGDVASMTIVPSVGVVIWFPFILIVWGSILFWIVRRLARRSKRQR